MAKMNYNRPQFFKSDNRHNSKPIYIKYNLNKKTKIKKEKNKEHIVNLPGISHYYETLNGMNLVILDYKHYNIACIKQKTDRPESICF